MCRAELDLEKLKVWLVQQNVKKRQNNVMIRNQALPCTFVYGRQNCFMQRQELQSDNKRLKQDLSELRKSLTCESSDAMPPAPGSLPYNILLEQLSSSNDELDMRKEEVLLLRSHMVRQEALKHKVRKQDSVTAGPLVFRLRR